MTQQTVVQSGNQPGGAAVIAPRVKSFGTRRYLWLLLLLPPAAYAIARGVSEIATSERTLAEEGTQAARVVTYELPVGKEVTFPVEPGAEILRVVIHPFKKDGPLPTTPLVAKLRVHVEGGARPTDETFSVPLSSVATRVRAEDAALSVGDPSTFDVDLIGKNQGETRITLESLEGVDGLLVRAFVREALDRREAERRGADLDPARARKLAQSVWEADLDELDATEREAVLGVRWRKLGVSRSGDPPRTWPLAIAPRAPSRTPEAHGGLVALIPLAGAERAAYVAETNTTVWISFDDPTKAAEIAIRKADGTTRPGAPETDVIVSAGEVLELGCAGGANVSLRAPDPAALQPYVHTPVYRVGRTRALRVRAPLAPLVLRLGLRRPIPRGTPAATKIKLAATATFVDARRADPILADVLPSVFDRYDDKLQTNATTERLTRFALVPQDETLELSAAEDTDVALAELDPEAAPFPVKGRPVDEPPPKWTMLSDDWHGFVPRNPSNASAFAADGRTGLRVARRLIEVPPPVSHANDYARLTRVGAAQAKRPWGGRFFEKVGTEWETVTRAGAPMYVPLRLLTDAPARVIAEVDGGHPRRRDVGVAQALTLTHQIDLVPGESFATIVLGDDLVPGKHRIRLRVVQGGQVWFHAPWVVQTGSHWVAGDFEN